MSICIRRLLEKLKFCKDDIEEYNDQDYLHYSILEGMDLELDEWHPVSLFEEVWFFDESDC